MLSSLRQFVRCFKIVIKIKEHWYLEKTKD
jgi:hypothetical protein